MFFFLGKKKGDLFKSTVNLHYFKNKGYDKKYARIEITSIPARKIIIAYFNKFPLLGDKNNWFRCFERVHNQQLLGEKLTPEFAKNFQQSLFLKLEERTSLYTDPSQHADQDQGDIKI